MTEERNNFLNTQFFTQLKLKLLYALAFVGYVFKRFGQNRCSSIAAELTVTSLLALVPLTTVIFALLAFIPSFQELGGQLQTLTFKYFVPGTGETIQNYINEFVGKARGLSGVGTLMLLVTALLMMRTIDTSFNKIWQADSNQSFLRTFLVYWAVLTLGPILLGSSLLITSYIQSLPIISDVVNENDLGVTIWLPFVMATFAFSVMFYVIPNRKIPLSHALLSGILTALLFELAKKVFTVFVSSFSTYQLIFGALASVPLFLIWIYLSWTIVLLGAEFCHGLDAFELQQEKKRQHPFINVVSLITLLSDFQQAGKCFTEQDLIANSKHGMRSINTDIIEKLIARGVLTQAQDQSYCLVIAADRIDYLTIFKIADRQLPHPENIKMSQLPKETKEDLLLLVDNLEKSFSDHLVIADYQE